MGFHLEEKVPPPPRLDSIPAQLGSWRLTGEEELDAATQALLRPDASLNRSYSANQGQKSASLYVGYFQTTQSNHPAPHSPNVCLPGAGWKEVYLRPEELSTAQAGIIRHNEYLLEKAGRRMMVLYWFQNAQRSWSAEVMSKLYMFPDYWNTGRTDISIVRVIVPMASNDVAAARRDARDFAVQVYPEIQRALRLPAKPF